MSMFEKLREYLDSEEGEKAMEKYALKLKKENDLYDYWLNNLHIKYSNRFAEILEKIIKKYDSDKYVNKEYKLGYQPREPLFTLFYDYAEKYGRECTDREWETYGNMFTGSLYYCNGYYFNMMHGQGTVIKVMREDNRVSVKKHYDDSLEKYQGLASEGAESHLSYYREKYPENYKILTEI